MPTTSSPTPTSPTAVHDAPGHQGSRARPGSAARPRSPGARALWRSEVAKLATLPSVRRNVVLAVVLGTALSGLLALAMAATHDDWSDADRAAFDPLLYGLSGSIVTLVLVVVIGVRSVAAEQSSGTLRTTFTLTPVRHRVVVAKLAAVAAVAVVVAVAGTVGSLVASQLVFGAGDLETAELTSASTIRVLVATALAAPLFPALGAVAALVLRSAGGALGLTLGVLFVPTLLGGMLPDWWQRNVLSLLPGATVDALAIGHLDDSAVYLAPAWAAVATLGWAAGTVALGCVVAERRDA